jgi:large subunit ribosomal protein L22
VTATKTNERPGTRAVHRFSGMSASKARQVLDLIRGQDVDRAAEVIGKVLTSAVANAAHNDQQNPEDLYVSACYADEGATMKRWRPRARGRATRIRKRTCHITIIVSRLPAERLELRRRRMEAISSNRSQRVAASRQRADQSGRISRRRAARAEAEAAAAAEAAAEAEEETIDQLGTTEAVAPVSAASDQGADTGAQAEADEDTAAQAEADEDTAAQAGADENTAAEADENVEDASADDDEGEGE